MPCVANDRLSKLRAFLRYVHLRGACPVALANAVSYHASYGFERRSPKVLTDVQRRRFLESFNRTSRAGSRDYAMALCMVDLGLRTGEVILLKLTDLNWADGAMTVPGIKAHPERTLPLAARLRGALQDYIDRFRPPSASDRVFLRHPRFVGAPLDRFRRGPRHALCLSSLRLSRRLVRWASASPHLRQSALLLRRPSEGDRRYARAPQSQLHQSLHAGRFRGLAAGGTTVAAMNAILTMATLVRRYLDHRRRLGYSLASYDSRLRSFAEYCDRLAPRQPITTAHAVAWASQTQGGPAASSARIALVRNFALYCANLDPRTEVPPPRVLGRAAERTRPHIFTNAEIVRLMRRARRLPATYSPLRPHTYETLIGLLACTGMRPCEALQLRIADFDPARGTLRVPPLKASPERELPLHPTTVAVLQTYLERRRHLCPMGEHLFVGPIGRPLARTNYGLTMRRLLRGFQSNGVRRVVRPYDLRHTFATKLIAKWSREDAPVAHRLLLLSRYLGHAQFTHTWWYVSAQGAALRAAAKQFERYRRDRDEVDA